MIEIEGFYGLMDEYYAELKWDLILGWPMAETFFALDLVEVVPVLKGIRQQYERLMRKTTDH